jgi:hypothetical protein
VFLSLLDPDGAIVSTAAIDAEIWAQWESSIRVALGFVSGYRVDTDGVGLHPGANLHGLDEVLAWIDDTRQSG